MHDDCSVCGGVYEGIQRVSLELAPTRIVRVIRQLKAGEVDVAYLPNKEVSAFEADGNFQIEKMEGSNITSLLAFNLAKPPMDNVHLRRAIMHAVNADAINKAVYFDRAVKADAGMWPVNSWVHAPNANRPDYSVEKAREELKLGGMPDGFEVEIVTWNGGSHPQAAEVVRALLLQVGIKAHITVLTVGTATEQFFQGGAYPIYLSSWSRYPEPDWIASLVLKSDGYYNAGNVENAEIDALIAKGAATYDQAERKAIYQQINDTVLGEAWIVPMLYGVYYAAAPDYVRNLDSFIAWDGKPDVKRIWIDPDRAGN